jgi:peptide/nickel transport system permease protein
MSASVPLGGEALTVGGEAAVTRAPRFLRGLLRRPVAIACLAYLTIIALVAIVAPIALPDVAGQHAGDLLAVRQGPSLHHHLLGTDSLGRDVLERLLVGARVTIVGVAEAVGVALALGVPFGLAAGFFGGWIDRLVSWLADLTFSIPAIVVVLVVLAVFPQSLSAAMVAFGVLWSPGLMRVVRSAVLPITEELYVAAARVSGLSRTYIITRHVLPRIAGVTIVQTSLVAAQALLTQTGLAFLSLVVAAPAPSWGGMVADGVHQIVLDRWLIWPPGLAIVLTILALGMLANAARDAHSERWSRSARSGRRARVRTRSDPGETRSGSVQPDRDTLLCVQGLTVSVEDPPTNLVEDVSFSIAAGEAVAVVGESGCVKSITAMSILGLLPGDVAISAGRIVFDGVDLATCGERRLRQLRGREIAFVSQEPVVSLDPLFRVGTQIAEVVRRHERCSRRAAKGRALELLARVRLPDPERVLGRHPHELSGGMAQRVAIARALAGNPRLLIADEPTTALDVTIQAEILDLLREIQASQGMAILLVTHDWGVVADLCQRAVVMYAGQVIERAEVSPVFEQPLHPYTAALLAADPHHTIDDGLLPTIPGTVPAPGGWPAGCHFHPRCRYATADCTEAAIPLVSPRSDRETRCIHHQELVTTP